MKNDSRKGLGIAGAIALGVAAVTAIVAVAKKKSSKPKQKRSIYKPELIKLPLKSEGEPGRVRPEFKEQPIREEDPYEYSYDSSYEEQAVEKQSFFKDVEVSYEDEDVQKDGSQTVSITDVVSEEVYVSEDQEIIIEAVMVGKPEEEQVEEQPEESVEEQPEEPEEEQVEEQSEEQDTVTIEEITVGRTELEEIIEEVQEVPVEEVTEEAVEEPLTEEAAVTYEEPAVTYEEAKDAWEGTPEPVIEFFEEEPVEEVSVEEPIEEIPVEEPVVEIPVVEEPVYEEPETIEPQVEEQALLPHESYYDWVYNVDEHYNVKTDGTWVYCLSDEILVSTSVNKKGGHETINIADTFKNKVTTRGYCLLKYIGNDREIVIPSEINGLPVVAAMNTFRSNQTIKKVTIPACMEAIRRTFYSCYHLDRIIIEKGSRIVYELDAIMCGNNDMDSGTESTTVCCTEDLIEYFKRHYKLGCPVVFEEIK